MLPLPAPYLAWFLVQDELQQVQRQMLRDLEDHQPPSPDLCQRIGTLQQSSQRLLPDAMRSVTV